VATELIAHRGAARERRENTLPAFELALELGADGIELDTHVTRDGVVVVHHDAVPRGTSSGESSKGKPIDALSAREVAGFRFPDDCRIPTLREVIDLVGDRATLYVELKGRGIEGAVVECLKASSGRHAIHAFDHAAVKRVRALSADMPTGILLSSYLLEPERALEVSHARDYWQSGDLVDAELVERVHQAGGRVIVWTVNSAVEAAALVAMGVDGICTDDLRELRAVVGNPARVT
jgi:glycerophosphoryl diester phosphodiesterase